VRKLLLALLLLLLMVGSAEAVITVPFVFTPFTTISSSQVNSDFSTVASQALDKRGDTMTGTLTTQVILPDANGTRNIGAVASQFLNEWLSGTLTVATVTASGTVTGANVTATSTLTGGSLVLTGSITGATTGAFSGAIAAGSIALTSGLSSTFGIFTGNVSVGGTLVVTGGTSTFSGNILPNANNTLDVGVSGTGWRDGVFTRDLYYGRNVRGPAEFDNGNSGTAITLNFSTNGPIEKVTRNGNCTFTLTAPPTAGFVSVKFVHDATASVYTVTFSPTVKFAGGTAPSFTNTSAAIDLVSFYWDGTTWYGSALANLQ
jgi:hypothetical protein